MLLHFNQKRHRFSRYRTFDLGIVEWFAWMTFHGDMGVGIGHLV